MVGYTNYTQYAYMTVSRETSDCPGWHTWALYHSTLSLHSPLSYWWPIHCCFVLSSSTMLLLYVIDNVRLKFNTWFMGLETTARVPISHVLTAKRTLCVLLWLYNTGCASARMTSSFNISHIERSIEVMRMTSRYFRSPFWVAKRPTVDSPAVKLVSYVQVKAGRP